MNLNEARKRLPELEGLSDGDAIDVIHEVYYPTYDKAVLADRLGYKAPPPPTPERSTMRAAGDLGLQFAGGAVSGVRMMSDVLGADNKASAKLRGAEDYLRELQSATAKADQVRIAEILKEAEDKGFGEQVMAGIKAFGVAPGAMMAQAAGTSLPTLATAAIPGVGPAAIAARVGAAGVMGAAQGAGNIKGVIYEDVKRALLQGGATPEEAEARAVEAQSYGGENSGQIALGGGLGALAGSTGMERVVSGLRNGVSKAAPGMAARVGMGAATEAVPEIAQGGQEKLASNLALGNEGFEVDPLSGVVSSATMEGMAGAAMGGATGIPRPSVVSPGKQVGDAIREAESVPESGPMTRAANIATEVKAQQVEAEVGETLKSPDLSTDPARSITGTDPASLVQPAPNPLMEAAREGANDRTQVAMTDKAMASMERQAQRDMQSMREYDRTPDPFADVPVSGGAPAAALPTDLLNPKGEPFKTKMAAQRAAKNNPGDVVPVAGGFVIRPAEEAPKPPRQDVGNNPDGFVNQNAQIARDDSDRLGLTADIEREFSTGKTVAQVISAMGDRLKNVPQEDRTGLIVGVRATLGIPSMMDEDGKGEFAAWKSSYDARNKAKSPEQNLATQATTATGQTPEDAVSVQPAAADATPDTSAAPGMAGGEAAAVANPLETLKLDQDWQTFPPDTQTLGLPRAEMPQVKSSHRGAMVNFLNARGVEHEADEVAADTLKPTQAEFSLEKVKKAREFNDTDRSILVSGDGYVVDGHHQWIARGSKGETVKVIRLKAPIADLLPLVREFPSSTVDETTANVQNPQAVQGEEAQAAAVEAPAPAGGDGAPAAGVSDAGATGDAQTDGVAAPAKKLPFVSKEEGERLFGVDQKRKAAIDRIAKGTAYFGTAEKAKDFITKNGIKDTHEAVTVKPGRIEVRAKGEAAAAPAAPEKAIDRRNRMKAEREQAAAPAPAPAAERQFVDEAPNGIKVGDRALVTPKERAGSTAQPFEGTVDSIEANPRGTTYGGTAFKIRKDDAKADGSGTAWFGIEVVSPLPAADRSSTAGNRQAPAEAATPPATPPATPLAQGVAPAVSANTIFTEDAAEKARARLKAKLGRLNSGVDPEMLMDGLTLAGYHIERGARTFSAFARAMVADLGEGVKPFLKSWYMGVKYDPRAAAFGDMDTAATVEAADMDNLAEPADTGDEGNGNATQQLDRPSTGALAGAPAPDVRAPGEGENAGAGPDRGGRGDGGSDARPDDAGGNAGGSLGGDARALPVPGRGTRADAPNAKKPRVPRPPRTNAGNGLFGPATGGLTPEGGANPAPNAPQIPAPQPAAQDFTITDELALGEGGQKTKFKNNVAAIRLMRDLEASGRMATPAEQVVLAKYVGWGGISQAFDAQNSDWAKEYAEITELMSPEELASARQSTRYAHYTSREIVVDGIYGAMRHFGFTGGKTLEAGAGVGNFIGLMPADMRSAGRFTAIEREPFSSAIARQLYPQQSVQRADFTEFKGTDAYFDAAVGNPPFASDPQTDTSGRKHLSGLSLHNYFFAKSIDMLREGGIMAQVVTNAFMDAKGDKARKYISDRVELLGAIRLPNSAFAKNANTEVTTDLIFFKKRPDSEVGGKAARADAKRWLNTGTYKDARGKEVALNQYFIDNPSMMLGDFGAYGTMYGPNQPALVARDGQDTLALLKEAVGKLPAGVYKSIAETGTDNLVNAAVVALKKPSVKEGGFFIEGDKLMQRLPDLAGEARGVEITAATQWTEKTTLGEPGFERIKALASMRSTVRGLLAAEMSDDAASMKTLRATLNKQYDAYRDTHGLINDPSTLRVFDDDPDFPLLASLEHGYTPGIGPASAKRLGVKPTKSTAKKGPIFTQRVVAARTVVQKVETPADALSVSMAERGRLDVAYIGQLLGMDPEEVLRELSTGDKPLLFRDPVTDECVLRDAYLSGNVRAKLAQAKEAGMFANINALEAVQPEDVASHEIVARLGSPWVPTKVYAEFAQSLYGEESKASVFYLAANSSYQVTVNNASAVARTNTWGTPAYPGDELLQAVMNNRSIKVTYRDQAGKTHTDIPATEAANEKAAEIKSRFNDWIFSDPERSELLTKAYNETNNNYVTRVYDGANMTFPGKVPDGVIKFRRHQRNAIARIVQDRTALLDHVVGAGKTFTVISGSMELKRTGLARKPMVAVPNHLVKQWAADFYRLYPGANVLTATKKDFEKANRRKFLARIATGDWDAVVIAHSSFGFIKPAPEFEAEFNAREISKIMATIQSVEDSDGDKSTKHRTVKQLEGMKERLENRIKALRDKPMDDLLDFEQIGVDQLFVDEAHMFKNLMYTTKMQGVAGLNDPTGSQRAYDMYVKTNQVMEKNGRGQGVVFATGTPVSNSLAEMYHMMRYLMPTQMRELGFESFDAWANTYASVEQVWMQAPSGDGFKAQNRMSNFVNTPELLKMFDQVSDTVTMDDIKKAYAEENNGAEFPLPKLKGGRRTPVSLDKSPAQDAYMGEIAKRAKAIEQRKGPPQKGQDNILVVMSDARKAAMDIRLVDPDVDAREPGGRIDRSTDEVLARYKQYDSVKGTQLVFSDLGTPIKHAKKELAEYEALQARVLAGNEDVAASATLGNEAAIEIMEDAEAAQAELDAMGPDWLSAVKAAMRGFSIYDDFKAALIEKGVPEAEIAFIHDYNTDDQKASLFRKVNAGQIRVLLGSTAKLGAGTNVQERLVAEHHLDVPWRPSDVEQREGRIERQGNVLMTEWPNFEIEILAYVTKDTLDMRMWQVQETKLKMINQLRTRKIGREIDNAFEDMELSAGEMQAAATGDINLLKEIQLRNDVKKLEQRRRSFDGQRNDLISRKRRNAEAMKELPQKVKEAAIEAEQVEKYRSDLYANRPPFAMNIDGKDYTDAKEAQAVLREMDDRTEEIKALNGEVTTKKAPLSVTIDGELIKNRATMAELFANARGDVEPLAWEFNGETYRRRTMLATGIRAKVLDAIADENTQQVGVMGPYSVAVEGSTDRNGNGMLEITLRRDGNVVLSNTISTADSNSVPARVIQVTENLMSSAVSEANYLERSLERAKKDASDLAKVEVAGDWPEQGKLDAARAAHKAILATLKQKGDQDGLPTANAKDALILSPSEFEAEFPGSKANFTKGFGVVTVGGGRFKNQPKSVFDTREEAAAWIATQEDPATEFQSIDGDGTAGDTPGDGQPDTRPEAEYNIRVLGRDIARFIGIPQREVDEVRPYDGRVLSGDAAIREIAEAFGSEAQGFDLRVDLEPADKKRFGFFGGVRTSGVVYLRDTGGDRPHLAVLGHELGHELRSKKPALYDKLVDAIQPYIDIMKYETEFVNSVVARNHKSPDKKQEEFIGEVLSDGFMDRDFWRALGDKNPSLLRQIGGALMDLIDMVLAKVGYNKRTERYLTDYKAVMKIAGEVMAEYGVSRASTGGTVFQRVDADAGTQFSRTFSETVNNVRELSLPAGYVVNDLFKSTEKLSWWTKTVGTMYNLAQRDRDFKPVFDKAQEFLNDVAFYAAEAANLAPKILPKLETLKDITKSPISAEDNKAIAAPIFEGTLAWMRDPSTRRPISMADAEAKAAALSTEQKAAELLRKNLIAPGVLRMWQGMPLDQYNAMIEGKYERELLQAGIVWTDAELKGQFKLSDEQVGLYREFRAAVDKSLASLAISDMVRFGGQDVLPVRDMALRATSVDQAADVMRQFLLAEADADPERQAVLTDTADRMLEKAGKAKSLMDRGYAPLSRFGRYSLDVVGQDGERLYFGLFESQAQANKMARQMRSNFPDSEITQGTVSQEAYKMFAGVSPETLELFGSLVGLEAQGDGRQNEVFQTYLKNAKTQRSAMKRLIQRKGIAGFSEDPGRVLAGFVYSNARQTSSSLHMGELAKAVDAIPKTKGELKDMAVKLNDYVKNPQEEAQALRGLLFAQYLGGSLSSALLNALQPVQVTFPWLSQYGGAVKAASRLKTAIADVLSRRELEPALARALKKAEEDGVVSPQEVFQLQAQAAGRAPLLAGDGTRLGDAGAAANNALSKITLAWGKLFGAAEQFNRRSTFIAAYRTAIEQRIAEPAKFAERAVYETQFVYSKANRPQWARGAVGATVFTFKQYSISYVELLHRMYTTGGPEGKRAALLGVAVLFMMSGMGGMPFNDDLEDLIDGFMQRVMNRNFNTKQAKREFFTDLLGRDWANFLERGVSGIPGAPIDVSGRLGMGNLIPGTGVFQKKDDYSRDLLEIVGPAGDLAKRGGQAAGKALQGEVLGARGALATLSPVAARNAIKGWEMATTGMYLDDRGRKVVDSTGTDALFKAVGIQPAGVAQVQESVFEVQRQISLNKIRESEIAGKWAMGVFRKDSDMVREARSELAEWNRDNPSTPIAIKMPQILKRVRQMNLNKTDRIAKTAPKEIRAQVREELREAQR